MGPFEDLPDVQEEARASVGPGRRCVHEASRRQLPRGNVYRLESLNFR